MLHFPWLETTIAAPLLGAAWVAQASGSETAAKRGMAVSALALVASTAAWIDFAWLDAAWRGAEFGRQSWPGLAPWTGERVLAIDRLSAPLLPLAALLYLLTFAVTLRTKIRRFSFAWALASEGILLAAFACTASWALVALLVLGTLPPYFELRARHKPTGVYVFHMAAFAATLVAGSWLTGFDPAHGGNRFAIALLAAAVLVRGGIAPFHCWMPDLFEHATFGTALLVAAPMAGAYAAVRLLLPVAPDDVLRWVGGLALVSSLYAAGMALVQTEARRFYCYLFLSHSALVFAGLDSSSAVGLTGALCVWLSVGLALGGLGLTLRALESRYGRLSLVRHQGLYDHNPELAVCFLLTGLASVGFPCTFGFVGMEMLVDGAVHTYPYVGAVIVLAAALNGIAILQVYFRLFTGAKHHSNIPLGAVPRERLAVFILAGLIFAGGLFPQPGVASRYRAAQELLNERRIDADVDIGLKQVDSPAQIANLGGAKAAAR